MSDSMTVGDVADRGRLLLVIFISRARGQRTASGRVFLVRDCERASDVQESDVGGVPQGLAAEPAEYRRDVL